MRRNAFILATLLALTRLAISTEAQEVSIPDPGLNAAIRAALHQPTAPLTVPDLLRLTVLDASQRKIHSTEGLEAARNLVSLDLQINQLTNFSVPAGLTNLTTLILEGNPLTHLTVPGGLTQLETLDVENALLTEFDLSPNLTRLVSLDLGFNLFTNFSFPAGLTNLSSVYFAGNPLTNVVLPPGLTGMTDLNLSQNLLTDFTLPVGMTNLTELDLSFNQLTNVALPADLRNLLELELDFNQLASLSFPSNLTRLSFLHLRNNQFTRFSVPPGLSGLTYLDLKENPLTDFTLPGSLNHLATLRISNTRLTQLLLPLGLTNLARLFLAQNQLTNVVLPDDLSQLASINLGANQLTSLTLPRGLTNLSGLFVVGNQLTNLTLPPDMTRLTSLGFVANPLRTFVLPEALAATNLAAAVASLREQGVSVFTYPATVHLEAPRRTTATTFEVTLTGPPGTYTMLGSADLMAWSVLGATTNNFGSTIFTDGPGNLPPQRFYRGLGQSPPTNMVFIPPNTFTLGTPAGELHRSADEGPQTIVTLSQGFWMGRYEVTQGEYQEVVGSNPSGFPGNLSRPVESVSWLDATNYCARLTQRERASGRIPPGSHYRLPTEAEWECAARAGTSTRFSYGDDPDYTSLTNHAWYAAINGIGTHPVGQKAPNPWGLYDMEGNVLEWCQDWYAPYPGGFVTDPQGPASNATGVKVIRGGAWDSGGSDCRSGRRLTEGVSPFITDFILGFRVVLVTGP